MYEAYFSSEMSTDDHVCHGTWPVVIDALFQRFLTKIVLQEAHDLVPRASLWPDEEELEFASRFSRAVRQCRLISPAKEKDTYYVCGLNPFICEEILKEP